MASMDLARTAADGPSAENAGERSIAAHFFTKHPYPQEQMPPTTFALPSTTLLEGLNTFVNTILFPDEADLKDKAIPFDFVVNDEYLPNGVTLETFLRRQRRRLGTDATGADLHEEVIHVEYLPAFQAQEGAKLPHDDWISCVRAPIYGNAAFLVTAAYDHAVRVWDAESCLAVGTGHEEVVKAVAVVPGSVKETTSTSRVRGRRARDAATDATFKFVSVSKDGSVRGWTFEEQKLRCVTPAATALKAGIHSDAIDTVDVDRTAKLVATGSWDTTVAVVSTDEIFSDSADVKPLYRLSDHARPVLSVRFSTTKPSLLYSTGLDGTVKMWDVEKGQLAGTLGGGDHAAYCLAPRPPSGSSVSGSSELLLTGHSDHRVRLYDPRAGKNGTVLKTWMGHRQWIYGVTWMWRQEEDEVSGATTDAAAAGGAATTLFASASEDATVRVWDLRSTASALMTLDSLHTDGVLDVTYAGAMKLASGGKDNRTKSVTVEQPGL